ncbi:Hypothetical protein D9617_18g033800 [Elsinoe fawcettii]|nr:Hypothetical protein D9617_18g033800 [Elsinoe fawcettii]
MSAAEAVALVLARVVKCVLLHLPQEEILRARRVSPRWRAIIDGEDDLQAMLGRLPRSIGELYCRRFSCQRWQNTRPLEGREVEAADLNPLVAAMQPGGGIMYRAQKSPRSGARYGTYYRDYVYLSDPSCTHCTLTAVLRANLLVNYTYEVKCDHGIDCYAIDQALSRMDVLGNDYQQWDFWIHIMYQEGFSTCHDCDCQRCRDIPHDQPGASSGRFNDLLGYQFAHRAVFTQMVMR